MWQEQIGLPIARCSHRRRTPTSTHCALPMHQKPPALRCLTPATRRSAHTPTSTCTHSRSQLNRTDGGDPATCSRRRGSKSRSAALDGELEGSPRTGLTRHAHAETARERDAQRDRERVRERVRVRVRDRVRDRVREGQRERERERDRRTQRQPHRQRASRTDRVRRTERDRARGRARERERGGRRADREAAVQTE